MIRYALHCPEGHRFDSWFRDGGAYEELSAAGRVACPECGSTEVVKSLMAPRVRPARSAAARPDDEAGAAPEPRAGSRIAPPTERERAIAALRRKVEAEADYVGLSFAREARAMHAGDLPERPIYGEARPAEAIELIQEGVPVTPLPFAPSRKLN